MKEPGHLDLTKTSELIPLLRRHGFHTSKSLGQHFLISSKVLNALADACELEDGLPVLEIGPGVGTVTRELAERGAKVTAIELDKRAFGLLGETVGDYPDVKITQGDILKIDLKTILGDQRWTVVGNLPYYITTPVISRMLDFSNRIARMIFMVQREVADRLLAIPGSRIYGSLSVFVGVYAAVERIIRVPRGSFLPPPTVDSVVVRLNLRAEPLVPSELREAFFNIVRAAFGQRRKTLENALAGGGVLGGDRKSISLALTRAGIASSRRGETLSIEEFLKLTEEVIRL